VDNGDHPEVFSSPILRCYNSEQKLIAIPPAALYAAVLSMDQVTPTGVGVVIIGVTLILRLVFDFIVKMKESKTNDGDPTGAGFTQKDRTRLYDLHRWHDRMDEDGVPVWYVRSGLEKTVQELVKAMEHQVKTQEALTRAIEMMVRADHPTPAPLARPDTQS
jgi:hypothetical protein